MKDCGRTDYNLLSLPPLPALLQHGFKSQNLTPEFHITKPKTKTKIRSTGIYISTEIRS